MEEKYLKILEKLSKKAYKKNDIPVSAILIRNNKIIAKAYNKKNILKNPMMHAEIICLTRAYKKLKRWNLNDCILYVTLEPCDMCKNIIQESRIDNVFFILNRGECTNKYTKTKYEQKYVNNSKIFSDLLTVFFTKIRKK